MKPLNKYVYLLHYDGEEELYGFGSLEELKQRFKDDRENGEQLAARCAKLSLDCFSKIDLVSEIKIGD